ncbi:unnamed protein product, partial [Allacma fusca]
AVPAPLPLDRVRDAEIFEVTGVDLAGPLYLKGGKKSWVVLFTCAVFRAVHLELVSTLSTEGFIQSLRRFVGRRGRPAVIYSDNGTNFVGTENLFRRVNWDTIEQYSSVRRIQWKFNPPTAAWWGGWWERLVRILKGHLRRVLGRASLYYEELVTILCDIESVVNSRPLTYVSEETDQFSPITPALFLRGNREDGVPEMDIVDHESLNRRWQYRQRLRDDMRRRFRTEYLGQLVQSVGKKQVRRVMVGEVVLVGSDNQRRLNWPLGKVLELIPGPDGNVRVVRVQTASGEILRPVQRIYPSEVSSLEEVNAEAVELVREEDKVDNCRGKLLVPKVPAKEIRTRSGRVIKAPVKYSKSYLSLFVD